jgi:hypothetical protein
MIHLWYSLIFNDFYSTITNFDHSYITELLKYINIKMSISVSKE